MVDWRPLVVVPLGKRAAGRVGRCADLLPVGYGAIDAVGMGRWGCQSGDKFGVRSWILLLEEGKGVLLLATLQEELPVPVRRQRRRVRSQSVSHGEGQRQGPLVRL